VSYFFDGEADGFQRASAEPAKSFQGMVDDMMAKLRENPLIAEQMDNLREMNDAFEEKAEQVPDAHQEQLIKLVRGLAYLGLVTWTRRRALQSFIDLGLGDREDFSRWTKIGAFGVSIAYLGVRTAKEIRDD